MIKRLKYQQKFLVLGANKLEISTFKMSLCKIKPSTLNSPEALYDLNFIDLLPPPYCFSRIIFFEISVLKENIQFHNSSHQGIKLAFLWYLCRKAVPLL